MYEGKTTNEKNPGERRACAGDKEQITEEILAYLFSMGEIACATITRLQHTPRDEKDEVVSEDSFFKTKLHPPVTPL